MKKMENIFMKNNINWKEVAKEAAEKAHDGVETIIFEDGTVTTVCGSWEARKPVLLVLGGDCAEKEIIEAMIQPLEWLGF